MAMSHSGCQALTMLVLPLKVLSRSSSGSKNRRQDMTMDARSSLRKSGTGKMSMVAKSTISSKDTESALTGNDLLLLWMSKGPEQSLRPSSECLRKGSSTELQDLSIGAVL